jgi:hypothetical protein
VKLVQDWQRVLRKAWSMRLMVLAGLLSAVEVALPFFQPDLPRGWFALFSGLTVGGAFMARLVAQRNMRESDDA